jgi:hypothetical protein
MSMVHGADADPHVLAELHMSAGCGSSQTYLLFALATVLPNIMTAVTSATLHERSCILMVNTLRELWTAPFQLKASAGRNDFSLSPPGQSMILLSFQGFILRSHCGSPSLFCCAKLDHLHRHGLLLGTSSVPIDDVDQLPGIFAEFDLKLTLFVDDQLGGRIENAGTLTLVGIV